MTTSNALLASLAIIKANWDDSKDSYLDNFLPFFLAAAKDCDSSAFSMTDASEAIWSSFGMQIPTGVLVTLSKRAAQKGYGRRENGSFFPDGQKMTAFPDIRQQRANYLRKQTALVNELIQFSKDRFGLIFTVEEAEDALLAHVEEYSTSLLGSVVLGQSYPNREDARSNQDVQYVVNSFISHVVSSLPQSFDHLEAVVKGSMLAVSLYLPNASEIGRRFERTTLYLDTPLIVRALGYEGAQSKAAVDDLLALCRASGADIACFEHSVQEVKGILDRASRNAARGTAAGTHRRQTDTHFGNVGATSSDILLLGQTLEEDISHLDIAIAEKPDASSDLTVDELDLEQIMDDQMSYQSRDALLNDLDSLTAIHRLREGRSNSRLETCKAILVTSNGGLARVGQSYFVRGGDHQWPVAITDHHLATLVWLKKPHAAPDLPRRQILADCFAALEPGKRLWDRYLTEIDRLKATGKASESDLMLLRYSTEAERSLMDRTLGNPEHVSSATVAELLEAVKNEMILSPISERDAALASVTTMQQELGGLQESLRHKERQVIEEQVKQASFRDETTELKTRVTELERADDKRRQSAASKATKHAARIHVALLSSCAAVLVVSALTLIMPPTLKFIPQWFRDFSPWCLVVATIGGFITLFFGGSVKRSADLARKAVATKLEIAYLRRAGLG